ncbi:hypothetical protein P3T29_001460 [Kitasatospora sp. MAP5-34]|nr:hypothetical protein [Kitasatospora sp. MAP5-34]
MSLIVPSPSGESVTARSATSRTPASHRAAPAWPCLPVRGRPSCYRPGLADGVTRQVRLCQPVRTLTAQGLCPRARQYVGRTSSARAPRAECGAGTPGRHSSSCGNPRLRSTGPRESARPQCPVAGARRKPTPRGSTARSSAGRSAVVPCRRAACTRPGRAGRRTRSSRGPCHQGRHGPATNSTNFQGWREGCHRSAQLVNRRARLRLPPALAVRQPCQSCQPCRRPRASRAGLEAGVAEELARVAAARGGHPPEERHPGVGVRDEILGDDGRRPAAPACRSARRAWAPAWSSPNRCPGSGRWRHPMRPRTSRVPGRRCSW